jgi:hypothetical protein
VALQGTIDAFPLTDVLQLLASSSKSGRLLLDGDRGRSTLWIEQGAVTGADGSSSTPSSAAVAVMELLRFADGSFEFHAAEGDHQEPPVALDPVPLGSCLEQAAALLEEWERIETVVPSLGHRVRLSDELVEDTVTLDRSAWALVASIVDRPTVATVIRRQGLDEFDGCAALASLVARSLVVIDEPESHLPELVVELDASSADAGGPSDLGLEEVTSTSDGAGPGTDEGVGALEFPERFPIDDLLGGSSGDGEDPWSSIDDEGSDVRPFAAAQTFDPIDFDSMGGHDRSLPDATAEAWDDVVAASTGSLDADPVGSFEQAPAPDRRPLDDVAHESTDEVLRQMSRLSPKAAEAIAAALSAPAGPESAPISEAAPTRREDDGPVTYLGSL